MQLWQPWKIALVFVKFIVFQPMRQKVTKSICGWKLQLCDRVSFFISLKTLQQITLCVQSWFRSRLGVQPLFGGEAMFSPRKTAGRVRLGSCHWRQQPNVKKVMLNMSIIFSNRGVWRRLHAVVHQIWQILCSEETLSRSLILSRVFSGYCGSLCSNLEQIWKIVHQRAPRAVWPRARLHIDMHVCLLWKRGILRLRFMLLYKEQNIT